ncbi:MAG: glutathione S-transferase family protein [Hyphomicrobiales bacterium]|nr:glutathione S-transferase family protein [Hyphomicrobiales bacterium]MBV9752243.1 glutathione S-transferase family protein [Hyphomicrobiales bacterium]
MKLYSLPLSPYAARVRGSIYAKGLAVEIVAPPADWRTSPEYRAINPLVRIPVLLLDDGTVIAESSVIVEYLEDAHPRVSLRPDTAEGLARVRLITQVADLYVMQPMMPLFYMFDGKQKDEAAIATQIGKLNEGLNHLEAMLLKGEYAFPGQLTSADVWLTPVRFSLEGLMSFAKLPHLLDDHQAVAAYAETAKKDAALGRVWDEMTEGLAEMMAARAIRAA